MRRYLQDLIKISLQSLIDIGLIPDQASSITVVVSHTNNIDHGDFSSTVAFTISKFVNFNTYEVANKILINLPKSDLISKIEVIYPGFINFFLSPMAFYSIIRRILKEGNNFGQSQHFSGRKAQVEFVSANPTGPLHVGHGRGAAYGAAVANLLEAVGYQVEREYYVNDSGRQMHILATSVWLRYLEYCGEKLNFPNCGYRGDYVIEIAKQLYASEKKLYAISASKLFSVVNNSRSQAETDEDYIDNIINCTKDLLGQRKYQFIFNYSIQIIIKNIKSDLQAIGVTYDNWYSEHTLKTNGAVELAISRLDAAGFVYEYDGALWFKSTHLGDEKDRVLKRSNGTHTYFAYDIAYHLDKFARGFDLIINIWGADHHGYIARIKAVIQALGLEQNRLSILLVQFAVLYRNGQRLAMSTRSGEFITLRELCDEVGSDATRFFYLMRKSEQHLDFDLDLAKLQSKDNPVYYVQYAHARICSVIKQLLSTQLSRNQENGNLNLKLLVQPKERELMVLLLQYPELIENAALKQEPHQLVHYLRNLANIFHVYYNEHRVLVNEDQLRDARINLSLCVAQVIKNGLAILGITASEVM